MDFVLGVGPFLFTPEVRAASIWSARSARDHPKLSADLFPTFEESLAVFPPFAFPTTPDEEALVGQLDSELNRRASNEAAR